MDTVQVKDKQFALYIEEERILHGDYLNDPYVVIPCDEY